MIYGFCGKESSGKTTCSRLLYYDLIAERGMDQVCRISFADPLYSMCHTMFGYAGFMTKEDYIRHPHLKEALLEGVNKTPRQILLDVGACLRSIDEGIFIKLLDNAINKSVANIFIIDDVRFTNEINYLKGKGAQIINVGDKSYRTLDDTEYCSGSVVYNSERNLQALNNELRSVINAPQKEEK